MSWAALKKHKTFFTLSFGTGPFKGLLDLVHLADDSHAASTAAKGRFKDDRKAVLEAKVDGLLGGSDWTWSARNDGHAGVDGRLAGRHFVSHLLDHSRRGADKTDAGIDAGLGKIGSFRKETVARMDGLEKS